MPDRLTPREILARLIAFPTVSRDSNLPLVDWLEEYLSSHGIDAHRYWNEDRSKAALFAHVGPWVEGAVVLSGHSDVVPVDGQAWDTDPFELVERDGKLFGRGTCDMKGFDALAIWALVEARYRDLARPLQLALSFDEEVGCVGAPPMIEAMQPVLPKGAAVIVGEPSTMQVVTGHKGGLGWHCYATGFEVHSSIAHKGVNAIMASAPLIDWANIKTAENRAKPVAAEAAAFDPPWSNVHVGVAHGGTAHNITAKDFYFGLSVRLVPGDDGPTFAAEFLEQVARADAAMRAVHPDAGLRAEQFFDVPALTPEAEGEAETLARALTGDNATRVVSYGTEAGQFQAAGYSAVVCGPGDIAQAHQPNEFLTLSQFTAGRQFMADLVDRLAQ